MIRILPVTNPDTKTFDYKVYDRVVRQFTNRSPTEFKEMQRVELRAARIRDLVRARVRVSEQEAFETFTHEKSNVTIRFARFRRDWFVAHALDLSREALDKWTKEHQDEVTKAFEAAKSQYLPECRAAHHILIKFGEGATDDEKSEARKRIEAAADRIKRGEPFEQVARDVSEDGSATQGGDLGCFQQGRMVKPFEEAAFALRPGEISSVVETPFGLHLIRLDGTYQGAQAEAEGRREVAKRLMIGEEGDTLAAESAKQVLAKVKAGSKLDEAVSEVLAALALRNKRGKSSAVETKGARASGREADIQPRAEISSPFNLGGDPVPGVAPGQNVARIAFALAKEGDTPDDLVKLEDGYAVLQLKEKSGATREQFDKDREVLIPAMLRAKQGDALTAYLARLREGAKSEIKVNESYAKAPEKSPGQGDEE
jgi:peptidyl-prolyl cis-trans isomerase D